VELAAAFFHVSPGDALSSGANQPGIREMADRPVRDLDDGIVPAPKAQAGAHGRAAKPEHRAILAEGLSRPHNRGFAEVLAAMPDVGTDADFERIGATRDPADVSD
jgi:plasmid stability protein